MRRTAGLGKERLRVLVSGASGLVGRALVPALRQAGHDVFRLVRNAPRGEKEIGWQPLTGGMEIPRGVAFDAVVHLAGENLAAGRWTADRKAEIRASRTLGTRGLVRTLGQMEPPPRVWVNASAIGFYGDGGDEILDEGSPAGRGFLAEVCVAWEKEAGAAEKWGARVVRLRSGMVLAAEGGALTKLRPVFRAGLGGRLGSGRQWMSWIALPDLIGIIQQALVDERIAGPVNSVAPQPVTNAHFTAALARALHRPAILPVPAWLLRTALGEMAEATLLSSLRVVPAQLQALGFPFLHPQIDGALDQIWNHTALRPAG